MSTNQIRAEKLLTFKDKEYKARMSLDTIIRIETILKISILEIGGLLSDGKLHLSQQIQILTLAIRGAGNNISEKEVKQLISSIGMIESIKMIGELITLALDVDPDNSDEEKKSEA